MGLEEPPRDTEGNEWPETPLRHELPRPRRAVYPVQGLQGEQPRLSHRTREMLTLIGVNAVLSLLISLAVVIVWNAVVRAPTVTPAPIAVATDTVGPTVAPPTATFAPGPGGPTTYRVQPGDTLLTIAAQLDVTVEAIMAANNLDDPNFIQIGQELIIPVGGLAEPTPTDTPLPRPTDTPEPTSTPQPATATPTATPTPMPVTPPATEPEVTIREILDAGVLADEAVLVFNNGRAVHMEGWTLTDAQDNVYTFPNLFLATGGSVRIYTGTGSNSATELFWGLDAPTWGEPGDVATLRDESGLVIDTFELP